MAKIRCTINEETLENDEGYEVDGVTATCGKCGHVTESFGTSEASIKRCLAMMRDQCPKGEKNYYEED